MAVGPVTVVLVDDADEVRRVVATELRLSGQFDIVAEGANGREAAALALRHQPQLMLLDVSMPESDGLNALAEVLLASPETHVVMLSGFSNPELERRSLALGATAFFHKSTDLPSLVDRLVEVCNGRSPAPLAFRARSLGDDILAGHLERFSTVFDQAAIGMATATLTGTIVRANRALQVLLRADERDLVGHPVTELAAHPARRELAEAVNSVGTGKTEVLTVEHHLARSRRNVQTTVATVPDEDGSPLYLFLQMEDVTPRHLAAEELRASEERFRLLVESVRDYAIFMLDPEGHVTTWNLGAERLIGYRANEIVGTHFRVFYPIEDQQRHHPEHELEIAVEEGRYSEEGWRVRKDGTRYFSHVVITALFDPAGQLAGFAKVTRDVTEQRHQNEMRELAAAELRQANERLRRSTEDMAAFVAMVAHELRSPVTAIAGATGLLERRWADLASADRAEMLASIRSASERLQRLVDDLLTTSRLESGAFEYRLEAIELAPALAEILSVETEQPADGITLSVDPDLVVSADRARLAQIVSNLVSNARHYGRPPISIDARSVDGAALVRVRDHGPGLAAGLETRLFGKFARGQNSGQGTGLGLFIVRELARAQGGDAWYERGDEGATSFVFRLPLAER